MDPKDEDKWVVVMGDEWVGGCSQACGLQWGLSDDPRDEDKWVTAGIVREAVVVGGLR